MIKKCKIVDEINHVLSRPDSYIGCPERYSHHCWVYNKEKREMEKKKLVFSPALLHIFDEILINAAERFSFGSGKNNKLTYIRVDISREEGKISIENDGSCIEVVKKKRKFLKDIIWTPEYYFGQLINPGFDSCEIGCGAKYTNIYSKRFHVEVVDPENGIHYSQLWTNNMKNAHFEDITSTDVQKPSVKVTFHPDLNRFQKMTELDDDIISVMERRCYDLAGLLEGVSIFLNGEEIQVKNFRDYVHLFFPQKKETITFEKVSDCWEVAIAPVSQKFGDQMSFVNFIHTPSGGAHVQHVMNRINKPVIQSSILKKNLKEHLFVFVKMKTKVHSYRIGFKSEFRSSIAEIEKESMCNLSTDFISSLSSSINLLFSSQPINTKKKASKIKFQRNINQKREEEETIICNQDDDKKEKIQGNYLVNFVEMKLLARKNQFSEVRKESVVFLASAMESVIAKLCLSSGNICKNGDEKEISGKHILSSIKKDDELDKLFWVFSVSDL